MGVDISQDGLIWQARIGTDLIPEDIKDLNKLLSGIQIEGPDVGSIDKALKQMSDDYKSVAENIPTYVKSAQDQLSALQQQAVSDAKTTGEQVSKALSSSSTNGASGASGAAVIGKLTEDFIGQLGSLEEKYKQLDPSTKEFINSLIALETELKQVEIAQRSLNTSYNNKDVEMSSDQYIEAASVLKSRQKELKESITELTEKQKIYDSLTRANADSINQKNAQLKILTESYDALTDAQRKSEQGDQIREKIQSITQELKDLDPTKIKEVAENAATASKELSNLKKQISSGDLNGKELDEAIKRAGELKELIEETTKAIKVQADSTAGLNALIQAVKGVAAAYTAYAGIQALVGSGSKTIEESIKNVTSALAILNGIQEFANVINKNSELNIFLRSVLTKNLTVATTEQAVATEALTAAEVQETAAAEGATIAQEELNVAMKGNPAAILILSITAVVTALTALSHASQDAREKQLALNEAIKQSNDVLITLSRLAAGSSEDKIRIAERDLALARARGASEKEIYDLTKKVNDAKITGSVDTLNALHLTEQQISANETELKKLQERRGLIQSDIVSIQKMIIEKGSVQNGINLNKQVDGLKQNEKDIQSQIDAIESITVAGRQALNTIEDASTKNISDDLARQEQLRQDDLKNSVAYWEKKLLLAKEGSSQERDATIGRAIAQRNQTVRGNPNLTPDEIALEDAKVVKAREDANLKYKIAQLENEKSVIESRIALSKEGSAEELKAKLDLIYKGADIEIASAKDNKDKILEITDKANREVVELTDKYNNELMQSQISTRIASLNTQLSEVGKNSKKELDIQKELVDQKALLDTVSAQEQIKNETLLQAKILEINAKALVDKAALEDRFYDQQLEKQLRQIDVLNEKSKAKNERIINNPSSTPAKVLSAQKDNINKDIDALAFKIIAIRLQIAQGRGDADKLELQAQELEGKQAKLEGDLLNIDTKKTVAFFKQLGDDLNNVSSAFQTLSSGVGDLNPGLASTLETLSDITSVGGKAASAIASFASGNIIGGVVSTISLVASVFTIGAKARASAAKAEAELKAKQDDMIRGEIQYNELLRDRARTLGDINELTNKEIKDRLKLLDIQKQQAQADYNKLLNQIRESGQQIVDSYTEKYGGFLGIGKKTKVVDVFAGLSDTTFDELEKLFTEGKLDDATKKWFQELQQVHDEIGNIGDAAKDAQNELNQRYTGTTADSILDGIVQGFQNGLRSAADFADNFQDLMKSAVINALKYQTLQKPLQDFYDTFAQLTQSGDTLTSSEIDKLREMYNTIIENAGKQFDNLQQITGISGASGSGGNSLTGAIKGMTEQTAELLAGQFGGLRITALEQLKISTEGLKVLQQINYNTSFIEMSYRIFNEWKINGIKIKP